MDINTIISDILLPVAEALLCALFGYLGLRARELWTRYMDNREKEAVARTVVRAVEQIDRDLHGEEKRQDAIRRLSDLLAARGISLSAEEATLLIESAVAEFNRAFSETEPALRA